MILINSIVCRVCRRKVLRIRKQRHAGHARVVLSLNRFGNQDIMDDRVDESGMELYNRMADYGGGLVPRRGLNCVDRVMQAQVQSQGGGRTAFLLKEHKKNAGKENHKGQKIREPHTPLSPRWGVKAQTVRPQSARTHSARDTNKSRQMNGQGTRNASRGMHRRPHSARAELNPAPNRHAMACDHGSIRARTRADGNRNIRAAKPAGARTNSVLRDDVDTGTKAKLADGGATNRHHSRQETRDQVHRDSTAETDSTLVQPGKTRSSSPFSHAWRRSRAIQLDRNQLLAKRAKIASHAGPVIGRARPPERNYGIDTGVTITQHCQPKTQAKGRPQSAAARMTTVRTGRTAAGLSSVRPSSAVLQLQERPQSPGTVVASVRRPKSAGEARKPAKVPLKVPVNGSVTRPASAAPRSS